MAIARADTLRTLAFGSISGTYAALGTALAKTWRTFKLTNNTNGDLIISFDGVNDNLFLPANSFTLYDLSTNAPNDTLGESLVLSLGTQLYVKQSTAPTSGAVYAEAFYAKVP